MHVLVTFKVLLKKISGRSILDKYDKNIKEIRTLKESHIEKFSSLKKYINNNPYSIDFDKLQKDKNIDFAQAVKLRDDEKRLLVDKYWAQIWIRLYGIALLILLAYFLDIVFPQLGKPVKGEYYSALSQIYPVILIAVYLTPDGTKSVKKQDSTSKIISLKGLESKLTGIMSILLGMTVTLVSIATGVASTFSLAITVFTLVIIVLITVNSIKNADTQV